MPTTSSPEIKTTFIEQDKIEGFENKNFSLSKEVTDTFNSAAMKKNFHNPEGKATSGAIQFFIGQLENWRFNPTASNLWTVEIRLHNDGKVENKQEKAESSEDKKDDTHTLAKLFENICSVNNKFQQQIGGYWDIESPNGSSNSSNFSQMVADFNNQYINILSANNGVGLFLAQGVKYTTHKVNVNPNIADVISPYAGFMSWGISTSGRTAGQEANIQFLETNWNIGSILFDRWIAAVSQQGLVEDGDLPNIKADIVINKYSPSVQHGLYSAAQGEELTWKLRETVTLIKAVPTSHEGDDELSYDSPTGPKIVTVNFTYQDYKVRYNVGAVV